MRLEVSGTRAFTRPSRKDELGGGDVLLTEQGVYLPHGQPVWQIGRLCLTSERLLFLQPRGAIFNTPLTLISQVATESKLFTVVRKPAMTISYCDPGRKGLAKAWFITPYLGRWLECLRKVTSGQGPEQRTGDQRNSEEKAIGGQGDRAPERKCEVPLPSLPLLPITQSQLERLATHLDPSCRAILWHLWMNRHATIDDLALLTAVPTHMDVLFKIRQGINPVAEATLGRPILVFEESRFDRETGEIVCFSWWLDGKVGLTSGWREPRIEVFDETHEINVIVEMPGVEEEGIRIRAQKEKVVVWVDRGGYHEEIPLPAPVDADRAVTRFNNGILLVNLKKLDRGGDR